MEGCIREGLGTLGGPVIIDLAEGCSIELNWTR